MEADCDEDGAGDVPGKIKARTEGLMEDGSGVLAPRARLDLVTEATGAPEVGSPSLPVPAQRSDEGGSSLPWSGKSDAGRYGAASQISAPAVHGRSREELHRQVYGALDLGTNNCRLLLARPARRDFRVADAFSRIIRLGEGMSHSGRLSDAAMTRTMEALRVCAAKIERHKVQRRRLVATQACRVAENGGEFLERVRCELGLDIEVLDRETEARLAVAGCASLIDTACDYVLVFDIGGGSSELIWLDLSRLGDRHGRPMVDRLDAQECIVAWISLSVGVVTLAERHGGRVVTADNFELMVEEVKALLAPFEAEHGFARRTNGGRVHMLGTSGTVTTIAGIELGLQRYDRSRVDGHWLNADAVRTVTGGLLRRSYEARVAEPCIGADRADLVLAGCAILEALMRQWPCERLRVADRGLREGILATLMSEDGAYRSARRRGRR